MTFREAVSEWEQKYNKFFGCNSPKVQEYRDSHMTLNKGIEWINEAKDYSVTHNKENEAAFILCFYVIQPMALKYFWTFLGPNPTMRKVRINNGDFELYLGMVYETLPKILKSFKPETYDSLEAICKGLQWWSRGYLKEATIVENKARAKQGDGYNSSLLNDKSQITKVERPDQATEEGRGWDRIESEANLYSSVEDEDFEVEEKFKKLANDPIFSSQKGIAKHNWKNIMAMALNGDKIEDIARVNNVTPTYVRNGLFSTNFSVDWSKFDPELGNKGLIQGLLNKYDISMEDFAKLLKNNPGFIVNVLKKNQTK